MKVEACLSSKLVLQIFWAVVFSDGADHLNSCTTSQSLALKMPSVMQSRPADLVEGSPDVNWTVLYDCVHHFRDGSREVWVGELRVKEDLWAQEPLIAYINCERLEGEG